MHSYILCKYILIFLFPLFPFFLSISTSMNKITRVPVHILNLHLQGQYLERELLGQRGCICRLWMGPTPLRRLFHFMFPFGVWENACFRFACRVLPSFWSFTGPEGKKWYLSVVLMCSFLTLNEIGYLFTCLSTTGVSFSMNSACLFPSVIEV